MSRSALILACSFALLSWTVSTAHASEKKTKEERLEEKEKSQEEKIAVSYDKIKEFSLNKYKTDPAFRDRVDEEFENMMRRDSSEAFSINTGEPRSKLVSVAEDTWRQHQGLYDNLLVQDHINRIGQKLVPADSEKLFAFRVVPQPVPEARTLSTGTIYISTGFISMLGSEAQLAFVLAHEMAHVQLDHWKETAMLRLGVTEYNNAQQAKTGRLIAIAGLAGTAMGAGLGRSGTAALEGGLAGAGAGLIAGLIMNRTISPLTQWDKTQEDRADEMAFKAVLSARYDVREVPRLYMALDRAAARDTRIQLGFIGERKRLKLRREKAEDLINNAMKADIEVKARAGFMSSSAEHRNLMAELKRDNGILAYYSDMFEMARTNLQDAVAIRDNDPAVHYFYAKTLKLVGRTDEDMRLAKESFFNATKFDTRNQNYGAHLHLALMNARDKGVSPQQIEQELDTYVTDYARWNAEQNAMRFYPPNLPAIYEYVSLYGADPNWKPKVPDLTQFSKYLQLAMYGPPSASSSGQGSRVQNTSTMTTPPEPTKATPRVSPVGPIRTPNVALPPKQ